MLLLVGNLKSELDGLIEAERAFAYLSVEKGSSRIRLISKFLIVPDSGFGRSSRAGACVYRP